MQKQTPETTKMNPIIWHKGHPYRFSHINKVNVFMQVGKVDVPVYSTIKKGRWVWASNSWEIHQTLNN